MAAITLNNIDKSNWKPFPFEKIAKRISESVDPNKTELEVYIGLEHLDAETVHIRRHGSPSDVSGGKLKCYPGDVIFGKRRAYQRKAGIVTKDAICSAHSFVFRANEDIIDARLFPFFLHSDQFMHRMVDISVGGLSPTINWSDLKHQEFLLPPKEQQAELAELLWAMDTVIEKDLEVLERLESNHLSLQANSFKTNTYESVQLKSFVKIIKGKNPILNEIGGEIYCTAEYLRTGNASQFIDDNNIKKAVTLNDNDVVVLWDGSNAGEILKGKKGVLASTMCKIEVLNKKFNQDFIRQFLNFKSFDIRRATVGSAIPHVDPGMIENIRIPILKENEQLEIIRKFNLIEDNISKLESKLQSSKALQKALINQVFSSTK